MISRLGRFMARPSGGPGFPSSLFAGGTPGGLWDISVLSSLYVERTGGGTTPASVDGVVGTIRDLSGNGNHMIAPSDGARAVLRQSGGISYLEADGVDDRYATSQALSAMCSASQFEVCLAGRATLSGANKAFLDSGGGRLYGPILRNIPDTLRGRVEGTPSNLDYFPYTIGNDFVWSQRLAGGVHYARWDNAVELLGVTSNIGAITSPLGLLGITSGGGHVQGRLHAVLIRGTVFTTAERLQVRQLMGSKNGVSIS